MKVSELNEVYFNIFCNFFESELESMMLARGVYCDLDVRSLARKAKQEQTTARLGQTTAITIN
jgi:hypothetical protein